MNIGSSSGLNTALSTNNDGCHNVAPAPVMTCKRLATIHEIGPDSFFYVLEDAYETTSAQNVGILAEGEQTWWAGELFYDAGNLDHPDSFEHVASRVGGRFTQIVPYATASGTGYIATLAANTPSIPMHGSDNASNSVLNEVDAIMTRQMRRGGIPGATLGIVQGGRLVHAKGYGYSDMQNGRETEPTDLFRIASVSKSIARAAVFRLAHSSVTIPAGLPGAGAPFTMDTKPWGQIFPYDLSTKPWRPNLGDVSVRDLVEHRSGLRMVGGTFCGCAASVAGCDTTNDNRIFCDTTADPNCNSCNPFQWSATAADWVREEAAAEASAPGAAFYHHAGPNDGIDTGVFAPACPASYLNDPTRTTPCSGSPWAYKNAGYHMIAEVIEKVSGQFYKDYVRANFLDPLNLDRVQIGQPRLGGTIDCGDGTTTPPFPSGLFQAVNYQIPRFHRSAADFWDERGNWVLCPRQRYGASSYAASPIDLLRWATSLDGSQPGYRGLDAAGWTDMGSTAAHGGYLPFTTVASLEDKAANPAAGIPQDLKIFFALNSDRFDRFDLSQELWNLLDAQSTNLPNRDLFGQYIQPPCFSNFHNLPVGEFQACFDHWVALGHWPTTLTVSQDAQRISGAFKPVSGRRVHHLIPAATYEQITQDEITRNSAPLHVNFVNPSGDLRATAMWQQVPAAFWTWWGMAPDVYETRWHDYYNQGFLQTDLFIYNDGGLKFAGTWKKLPHDGFASYWGMTDAVFTTRHSEFTAQGLKLVHFIAYRDAGQLRFAAIWQRVAGQYELTRDTSGAAYQTTFDARNAAGWSLHQLHSYDVDSFAAVWSKPGAAAGVFSMDSVAGWQIVTGSGTLTSDALHTEGNASIAVSGGGFIEIRSPTFSTAAAREQSLGTAPNLVAIDVYLASPQPNPWWLGAVQMYLRIPSAGLYHEYISQVELTGKPLGTFSRLTFALPQWMRNALAGNYSDAQVFISVNTPQGAPAVRVDNLRFLP
jgi:CubicO group peptidase (beta-lactamase class C family)